MALTFGQQRAFDLAMSGKNLFITGSGGVGKSFLVEEIINKLKLQRKNVLVTASTGKAALLVKGVTCHRAFSIPIHATWACQPKITEDSPVYEADVVLIDEVSMLRLDVFEFIVKAVEKVNFIRTNDEYNESRKKNKIQIIVVGDFCQLPPVIIRSNDGSPDEGTLMTEYYGFDVGAGYAFSSPAWNRCNFVTCELTEVIRQSDQELIVAENRIRFGERTALSYFAQCVKRKHRSTDDDAVYLCGKKRTADRINEVALSKISNESEHKYYAIANGEVSEQDKQAPQMLTLKRGAHVIMLLNTENYRNGSSATVTAMYSDRITVKLSEDDQDIEIPYYTWSVERYVVVEKDGKKSIEKKQIGSYSQLPIRLGYAITIHKAQGQTLDKAVLVLGKDGSEIFTFGQFYVGVSRIRNIESLRIDGDPNAIRCLADPSVLKFYGREQPKQEENTLTVEVKAEQKLTNNKRKKKRQKQKISEPLQSESNSSEKNTHEKEESISPAQDGFKKIICPESLLKIAWSYAHIKDSSAQIIEGTLYATLDKSSVIQRFVDDML